MNDLFAVIPNVPSVLGYCQSAFYTSNEPCIQFPTTMLAQTLQQSNNISDLSTQFWRGMGMNFSGPNRQYGFNTSIPIADGTWLFTMCDWCDGIRSELVAYQVGNYPPFDSAGRGSWGQTTIQKGPATTNIAVGYWENEPSGSTGIDFYATTRAEETFVDGSTTAYPYNFNYGTIDTAQPVNCSISCVIPSDPGRMLYYSINGGPVVVVPGS